MVLQWDGPDPYPEVEKDVAGERADSFARPERQETTKMNESLSQTHPLFDPSSLYNQMRATVRAKHKVRGYWHWLCFQAKGAQEPLPPNEPRSDRELHGLACRL